MEKLATGTPAWVRRSSGSRVRRPITVMWFNILQFSFIRLQMRDWTDKEGNKRRSAEIIAENIYFGDSKTKEDQEPPASSGGPVEAAGGDPFGGLPDGFAPNFGEPADDGSLPF